MLPVTDHFAEAETSATEPSSNVAWTTNVHTSPSRASVTGGESVNPVTGFVTTGLAKCEYMSSLPQDREMKAIMMIIYLIGPVNAGIDFMFIMAARITLNVLPVKMFMKMEQRLNPVMRLVTLSG